MKNGLVNNENRLSGLLLIALASGFGFYSKDLTFGSISRMGPGFLPITLAAALAAIGLIFLIRSFFQPGETIPWPKLRVVAIICAAPVLFGLIIAKLGLVISVIATAFLARCAIPQRLKLVDVVSFLMLSAFCALIFVVLLSQPIAMWP